MFQDTPPPSNFSIHDWVRTVGTFLTLIISIINLFFVIKFFRHKDKKEDENKEQDLKVSWFKSLILDYNLDHFYKFFQETDLELQKLKAKTLTLKAKQKINETIKDHQISLRKNFVDMLLAVDKNLYDNTLNELDILVDCFTEIIFNPKVNLTQSEVFEENISQKLIETKTNILKLFFGYKG